MDLFYQIYLRRNDRYLPSCLLPFFHRLQPSKYYQSIYYELVYHFRNNTKCFLLSPSLVSSLLVLVLLAFWHSYPKLRLLLRSNVHYLPRHLLPFFRQNLTSNFLPTHFLQFDLGDSSTTLFLLLPNLVSSRLVLVSLVS